MKSILIVKYAINIILIVFLFTNISLFAKNDNLKVYSINPGRLNELHDLYVKNKLNDNEAFKELISKADDFLNVKPVSVMDKSQTPSSGDKHDYMSMGPYWWPNPNTKNGLPYIRKDGERNAEINKITDHVNEGKMTNAVGILSLAYYITKDSKYSSKASKLLHVWFLDDSTKMNPNLNYAQGIPGICTGRGIGIIELSHIYNIIDAIGILETSNEWAKNDDEQIHVWFEKYLSWLRTSKYGNDESGWKNNHGSWYDVQVASISLFLGKKNIVREVANRAKLKRIDLQIKSDGSQPLELERTKSWGYSSFNLNALCHLAYLADHVGIDLWHFESPKGGAIRKALDFILPPALNFDKWKYKQIQEINPESIYFPLLLAEKKFDKNIYSDWKKKIFDEKEKGNIDNLLY
jgi:Alginate lyase